jgi:hypothetical protein
MPFDQSTLLSVLPPVPHGPQWVIAWTTSSPPGTWWQIYIDGALAWSGQATQVMLPAPDLARVAIGAVLAGEENTDFSGSLPPGPLRRATLTWQGGLFEGADLAAFNVYQAAGPGVAVTLSNPVATITAYPAAIVLDGYGYGGYGQGGYGSAAGSYSWESGQLASGSWQFAVVPVDQAGNLGTPSYASVTIAAPPSEPPPFADGARLHYTMAAGAVLTLLWNASSE